ncbi:DUF4292 domain-containing protein [Bacteroides sp. 224]|uniref:DUF4292 domain-containing protein n=1 Tax=Bacteroides sp. 224 TaxID=2302936 RepID=UPI0013D69043|nr:DUF4292 domain-containing protein [Bacteroides sp. 224]NDV64222.1 DUF4292 domain-containing protein [Bacteroides sp. 224]
MKKYIKTALYLGVVVVMLSACKSSKTVSTVDNGIRLKGGELLEAVINNTPDFESFSSRLKLTLPARRGDVSLSGYLKMQHDELIQISLLIPIIRSEAARIEISPDRVLVIDRMNKRYADVPVEELHTMFGTDINFATLQALFTNSFFVAGKTEFKRRDFSSFRAMPMSADNILFTRKSKKFDYSFVTSRVNNRLVSSEIGVADTGYSLNWLYDKFVEAGQTTFPSDMQILLKNSSKTAKVSMELSRISVNAQELAPTAIPTKYQSVSLSEILEKLKGE